MVLVWDMQNTIETGIQSPGRIGTVQNAVRYAYSAGNTNQMSPPCRCRLVEVSTRVIYGKTYAEVVLVRDMQNTIETGSQAPGRNFQAPTPNLILVFAHLSRRPSLVLTAPYIPKGLASMPSVD